jgi:cytochrome P450 family 6
LHQDIEDRLLEEIDVVLEKHDGKITYEGIQEMEYLDKVVSETLRKYPPIPNLHRECTKDYKIPGTDVVLEKGITTFIPVLALHYDPKYYPEPERFDPERFNEEEKAKRHHYVYLPFGEGPRLCIAMRFGLMQIKVGLVSLLSKYQFSMSKKTPIPLVLDPRSNSLFTKGGMWLQIRKRVE